jgi:hypothetical protein
MHRFRDKLTYSNVMVTVLAFIVLAGGSAYAASAVLKPNSVGSAQLKSDSVGEAELKDESVGSLQMQIGAINAEAVAGEAISTPKLKNGSVTLAKLSATAKAQLEGAKGEPGAAGATGAQGVQGIQGPPGTTATATTLATERVTVSSPNDSTKEKEVTATCPSNKVISGGYVLNSNGNLNLTLRAVRDYAVSDAAWLVRAINGGSAENWELAVVAVCQQ